MKLLARGQRVTLQPLTQAQLQDRWARGDYELMLYGVLLPPLPAPALAVVLELAGRQDLLGLELPALGAIPDPAQRDARARERARALAPRLPVVPLFAQPLRRLQSAKVQGLSRDAFGLPRLEEVSLRPPPTAAER